MKTYLGYRWRAFDLDIDSRAAKDCQLLFQVALSMAAGQQLQAELLASKNKLYSRFFYSLQIDRHCTVTLLESIGTYPLTAVCCWKRAGGGVSSLSVVLTRWNSIIQKRNLR